MNLENFIIELAQGKGENDTDYFFRIKDSLKLAIRDIRKQQKQKELIRRQGLDGKRCESCPKPAKHSYGNRSSKDCRYFCEKCFNDFYDGRTW